jgi:hypothetical protein
MSNVRLKAQLREYTGLSPAEAVFGVQIVLPNKFLQNDEFSVDTIVNKLSKTLHVSAPSLSRHNSSINLPSELPAELLSTPLVWVRWDGLVPPLQPLYDGPYTVLPCSPRSFTHQSGRRMRWLPSAALRLARPRTPRLAARVSAADRRACAEAVLPQPSGSCFQTHWFLRLLLFNGAATRRSWNHFPTQRGGFCTPGTGGAFTASTNTVPVPSAGTAREVGPLTSSPSQGQSWGGSPVESCLHPLRRSYHSGVL